MDISHLIKEIKGHPKYPSVGMIVCHNGVVRSTSRDGKLVSGMRVTFDRSRLKSLLNQYKKSPGIVEILVEIKEGTLQVGDDIMYVVVAGDKRENVFPVLEDVVHSIKEQVVKKIEYIKNNCDDSKQALTADH